MIAITTPTFWSLTGTLGSSACRMGLPTSGRAQQDLAPLSAVGQDDPAADEGLAVDGLRAAPQPGWPRVAGGGEVMQRPRLAWEAEGAGRSCLAESDLEHVATARGDFDLPALTVPLNHWAILPRVTDISGDARAALDNCDKRPRAADRAHVASVAGDMGLSRRGRSAWHTNQQGKERHCRRPAGDPPSHDPPRLTIDPSARDRRGTDATGIPAEPQ